MTALVCLATCNGERWLEEQVESLLAQDYREWRLLVSDDGSTDATPMLLQHWARRDSRIELLPPLPRRLGACANFERLLRAAQAIVKKADFIALCDQDDRWHRSKLDRQHALLAQHSAVCSDLNLIDAEGAMQAPSFLASLRTPANPGLRELLAQNWVIGCTLAIRPAVLDLALPFPGGLRNHDWWLALCSLCASAEASLALVPESLVDYRQHPHNAVGAYRPHRQLWRVLPLVRRQRAVLQSQIHAIAVLQERLLARELEPPALLRDYRHGLEEAGVLGRPMLFLRGPFAPSLMPLRLVRAAASLQPFEQSSEDRSGKAGPG